MNSVNLRFFFCNSRSKVQSPATELLSRSETRRRPPPFQQPQDKQDENRRIDYDAYSDYDYNDFDSEIPFLLNQCKSRNNRKNAGKSLMKNIESMPKFEHFPMRSGQLLSSGLESRLSDLGRAHHMFSRILILCIYDIFFTKFHLFCFFHEVEASIEIKTD